jgi:hypothetical protein
MKIIVTLLTVLLFFSCISTEKQSFKEFQISVAKFENHYHIGDTVSSMSDELWNIRNFIDTDYLLKYKLIDTSLITENFNKIQLLEEYRCAFIGQYTREKIILILSYSLRSTAGDGEPIITATTFSETGRLIDILRINLEAIRDPFYQPTTYFNMNENLDISVILQIEEYVENDEQLVLTKSKSIINDFVIQENGKFIEHETRNVFTYN